MLGNRSTNGSTMDLLSAMLTDIEGIDKQAGPDTPSYMDSVQLDELEQPPKGLITTNQRGLGKEQTAEADNAGSTVDSTPENKDSDADVPTDDQGPSTLDTDETLRKNSEVLGKVREQMPADNQKVARAHKLGTAILRQVGATLQKQAAPQQQQQRQPLTEAEMFVQKCAAIANQKAAEFRDVYMYGMMKRAEDASEILRSGLDPQIIEASGGVDYMLDKVAMEEPEAIMPEGMEGEMDMGGGDETAEMEQLAAELDAAGVEPEELAAVMEDVEQLTAAGVEPEELAQAIQEIAQEDGAMEAPPQEKMAHHRARIDAIKATLRD